MGGLAVLARNPTMCVLHCAARTAGVLGNTNLIATVGGLGDGIGGSLRGNSLRWSMAAGSEGWAAGVQAAGKAPGRC